ncbi:MFS transporter [Sanguibacter sp. A247]|uniref:MFS transporter n=1 Tax=unclassified Sanguibacter TaxID=2645534 RepID=UPI003FD8801F
MSSRRRWAALAVLLLPVLLVSIDNTVLSFALPQISAALTPSGTQLLWIVDVYPLVLAALLVPMGSLADRFGRRRMLLVGSTGFALVSALAAYAPSAEWLVAGRAAMGLFGAMLMPSTMSLIRNIFTDRSELRLAIAIWAAAFSGGAALGPIVGGFLLEHAWWGSVFLMSVPVLTLMLVTAPFVVPESRDPRPGPFDITSILLSVATITPVVFGIKELAKNGITAVALATIAVGVVSGAIFVRRQLRRELPMLDVRLFANPAFGGGVLVNLLSVIAITGFLYFVSQDLQLVVGLRPLEAGMALLPGLIATIVAGLLVVKVVARVAPGRVIAACMAFAAIGYAIIALAGGAGTLWPIITAFVILSVGAGAAETVSNDLILSSAPAGRAGAASAISETAYELGAVLGTAILGGIMSAGYHRAVVLPPGLTPAQQEAARETLGGAASVADGLDAERAHALLDSAHGAFAGSVVVTSWIGVALMVAAVVVSLAILSRPQVAELEDHVVDSPSTEVADDVAALGAIDALAELVAEVDVHESPQRVGAPHAR